MSTYVVSDLHGYYDVFRQGLKTIKFNNKDRLYVIGDAIDRGPDGIRILREILRRENMDLILGNHEFMMLNAVDLNGSYKCSGNDADLWLYSNGGLYTYSKYILLSVADRKALIKWLTQRMLIKQISFISQDTKETQIAILTHSYFDERYLEKHYSELSYDAVWDIVWRSMFRYDTFCRNVYGQYEDKIFITGHVPVQRISGNVYEYKEKYPEPYKLGNLINIDGGLSFGHYGINNAAIFLRLEDMTPFVIPLSHEGYEYMAHI